MISKHPNITYAYHFINEAMIVFLLLVPIFHLHYKWVPYWSYLTMIVFVSVLYTIIFARMSSSVLYLISLPVLILVFSMNGYPLLIGIILASLLVWRAINIWMYIQTGIQREHIYIILILALTTFLIIFFKDIEIVVLASVQFIMLIAGYIISHLSVIRKEDKQLIGSRFWLGLSGLFIIWIIVLYPVLSVGRFVLSHIYNFFAFLLSFTAGTAGNVLSVAEHGSMVLLSPDNDEMEEGIWGDMYHHMTNKSIVEIITPVIAVVSIIVVISLLIFYIRLAKTRNQQKSQLDLDHASLALQNHHSVQIKRPGITDFRPRLFRKRIHPIRQLVYSFERDLLKIGFGRLPFETIESWFDRLELSTENLELYQKARYGYIDVEDHEVKELKDTLHSLKKHFNDIRKDIEKKKGDM